MTQKWVIALILRNIVPRSIYYIARACLSLVCLHANIVLLGTSLVRTKLEGGRMDCNIGQDATFLTHSEILYI